ncbi:MAG TPA: hypothetical protein VET89_09960 [Stellaceae bacterium]|nr:hypothetical protein [Stellaceae bacterium]
MADQAEWFKNPEHAHVVGLDAWLASELRSAFGISDLQVDCGVEGKGPYTYHFTISNVPADLHGQVSGQAMDLLSSRTGYRFEVHCT